MLMFYKFISTSFSCNKTVGVNIIMLDSIYLPKYIKTNIRLYGVLIDFIQFIYYIKNILDTYASRIKIC